MKKIKFTVKKNEQYPGFAPGMSVYDNQGRVIAFILSSDPTGEMIHQVQKWCYLNGKAVLLFSKQIEYKII